jgi:transposase
MREWLGPLLPGSLLILDEAHHAAYRSLALMVQEDLKRDPHCGDLYVFRGRRSNLIKIIWHDGQGACLFSKRLERGGGSCGRRWPTAL